jgi:hypothetical protein
MVAMMTGVFAVPFWIVRIGQMENEFAFICAEIFVPA